MKLRPAFSLVLATTFLFVPRLDAHVAPSENTNNRYIKLTPLGDRVRLSYTVYMGQRPGALARLQLDSNRDGVISDAEAEPFAVQIGTNVAAHLEFVVDGVEQPIAWSVQMVGLGTPSTRAGAFSVDLLGWLCLRDAAAHQVTMRDRFRVSQPGETELRLTESPGVRITRATLGARQSPSLLDMKWMGTGGPLETDGLVLEFTVDDAARDGSRPCDDAGSTPTNPAVKSPTTTATATTSHTPWWIYLIASAALLALLTAIRFGARRRRA